MDPSERKPSDDDRSRGNGSFGDNPWRAAGLVGSVGASLGVCLGLGYWLGFRMDNSHGTAYWSIMGMIAGLAIGIVVSILLIRAFTGGKPN